MRPPALFFDPLKLTLLVPNNRNWDLIGTWRLFASPVMHIVLLQLPGHARSADVIAFISANSPIALVSLFPPQLLFVLPGTRSSVETVATSSSTNEILVIYSHGLSRICHVDGKELRRSMDYKTARGVLKEGGWKVWFELKDEWKFSPTKPALLGSLAALLFLLLFDATDFCSSLNSIRSLNLDRPPNPP